MQTHAFSHGSVCVACVPCSDLCGMICLNVWRCCGWFVLNAALCSGCFVLIFGVASISLFQTVGLALACMSSLEPLLWMACLKFVLGFCWLSSAWCIYAQRSIVLFALYAGNRHRASLCALVRTALRSDIGTGLRA